MYEVMARRYRPGTFDEVVGQEHIAGTLRNAISRDRVAHAYLFTGGHGCGKTTMARILAKALVCQNGPTPDPCGVCPICLDVAAGRDADVLEIDGASNNGVEQIRQLREQAAYVPTRARFKIYIIDEVHMLSDGAFNALLKTLEEPPRHVKFILATTDPHKIPDTILSRCQRFDFRLVPQAKLAAFFRKLASEENASITDEALEAVAANAEGSVRDGLVLLDQLLSFADGEVTRQDVESVRGVAPAESVAGMFGRIADGDVAGALAIVDETASRGANVGDFLDQLIMFGRDLMLLTATGSAEGATAYGPAREALVDMGKRTSLETALLYLDALTQARTRVRSRALTNPLVALEMAVARLAGLAGVTPLSDLIAKLESAPKPAPGKQEAPAPFPERPAGAGNPAATETSAPTPAPAPAAPPAPAHRNEPDAGERIAASASREPEKASAQQPAPSDEPERRPDDAIGESDSLPLDFEDVKAEWGKVLDILSEKHPADLRHMEKIAPINAEGGTVTLAGPATAVEAWDDRHRLGRLTAAAESVFGRRVDFMFEARHQTPGSARSRPGDDETKYRLMRHPAVEKIRDLFDGVVVDCRVGQPIEQPAGDSDGDDDQTSEGDTE